MTREWDAGTYDRVADPMTRWGVAVLARLPLDGHERVLDAGCGSGRVTELLADRLPRGTVVALDGSHAMVDAARARLARFGERVEYVVADLLEPIPVAPVDAILSTATFHWVLDHDRLFRNLAAVLRAGGRLVAQCGGAGNIARVDAVLESMGIDARGTHLFATPEETEHRLRAAGFTGIRTWLQPEPTRIDKDAWEAYLRTVCLSGHLTRIPEGERAAFVAEVVRRLERPELDYVRLNIDAIRAG